MWEVDYETLEREEDLEIRISDLEDKIDELFQVLIDAQEYAVSCCQTEGCNNDTPQCVWRLIDSYLNAP